MMKLPLSTVLASGLLLGLISSLQAATLVQVEAVKVQGVVAGYNRYALQGAGSNCHNLQGYLSVYIDCIGLSGGSLTGGTATLGNDAFYHVWTGIDGNQGEAQVDYGDGSPCIIDSHFTRPAILWNVTGNFPADPYSFHVQRTDFPGTYVTNVRASIDSDTQTRQFQYDFNPPVGVPWDPGDAGYVSLHVKNNTSAKLPFWVRIESLNNTIPGALIRRSANPNDSTGTDWVDANSIAILQPIKLVGGSYRLKYGRTNMEWYGDMIIVKGQTRAYNLNINDSGSSPDAAPCDNSQYGCNADGTGDASGTPDPTPSPSPGPTDNPAFQTDGFWTDVLKKSFVPQQATLDNLKAAVGSLSTWGPFGIVSQIQNSFLSGGGSCGSIGGPQTDACAPVIALDLDMCASADLACPQNVGMNPTMAIDLRPAFIDTDGLHRGSDLGTGIVGVRRYILGPMMILLGLVGFVKRMYPKPTT